MKKSARYNRNYSMDTMQSSCNCQTSLFLGFLCRVFVQFFHRIFVEFLLHSHSLLSSFTVHVKLHCLCSSTSHLFISCLRLVYWSTLKIENDLRLGQTIEHCRTGSPFFSKDIQYSWTGGGKTLSNIVEWAVQHILEMSYLVEAISAK